MRYIIKTSSVDFKPSSLINCLLCAYGMNKFDVVDSHKKVILEFRFNNSWFKLFDRDFCDMTYDQFFLSAISLILTRSERDKFIKKLRRY